MNISEICKQLKIDGKIHLIWSREDGRDFISNRHYLFRFDELPRQVLVTLFSIYYRIPHIGETIVFQCGQEVKSKINFGKLYEPDKQCECGSITNFIYEFDKKLSLRVVKIGQSFRYINNAYIRMASSESKVVSNSEIHSPIYLRHDLGDLMILPYRTTPEEEVILELEEIINDQIK